MVRRVQGPPKQNAHGEGINSGTMLRARVSGDGCEDKTVRRAGGILLPRDVSHAIYKSLVKVGASAPERLVRLHFSDKSKTGREGKTSPKLKGASRVYKPRQRGRKCV